MSQLPAIFRRGLAIAILMIAVAGIGWMVVIVGTAWQGSLASIQSQRELLGKFNAIAGRSQEIDAALRAARENPGRGWFIDGASEALITAQLQQRLQNIVAMNGAQFQRASEAQPERREEQDYRGIRIELTGTLESIQKTLVEIETGIPYLFISRLQLGSDQSYSDGQSEPQIQAEIDVYGAVMPVALRADVPQ